MSTNKRTHAEATTHYHLLPSEETNDTKYQRTNTSNVCPCISCRGTMISGRVYDLLIDAEVDVGEVKEVKFRWNNHIINPLKPRYGASKMELQIGKDKQM